MEKRKNEWKQAVIVLLAAAILLCSILGCRAQIIRIEKDQMINNLQDVGEQNVTALENEIEDKKNLLRSVAEDLQRYSAGTPEDIIEALKPLADCYHFKRIGFVYADGSAYTTDGYQQDLSFRNFFRKSMKGEEYITDTLVDTLGEAEKINVFSVPVYGEDDTTVEGVLFATYRTSTFREILDVESFSGEGCNYIITTQGDLIAYGKNSFLDGTVTNLFNAADSDSEGTLDAMIADIQVGNSGAAALSLSGDCYVYYTPLSQEIAGAGCYVLTVVSADVLSTRLKPLLWCVNALFIVLTLVVLIAFVVYICSYRMARQELLSAAYVDPLTGDDNMACFVQKLQNRREDSSGYVVSMDLSAFKIVNNTCGVEKGDEVLKSVWTILLRIRMREEYAARINADHFVLFLAAEDKETLIQRLNRITELVENLSGNINIPKLSPYFGAYAYSGGVSPEEAYSRANEAKHLIKGRRDVNYGFYDDMDFKQIMRDKALEDRFADAIAYQEFEVWYQPKYSVKDAKIVGSEALTRWRGSDGNLIPPSQFIPLFEKNGMIAALDEYVFRTVCRQQKKWESEGRPMLPVSVNISRASLYYANVVEKYKLILEEYGVQAKYVPLEITESATIDNMQIRQLIEAFHAAGFPLLLDDFGNGYSSLSTLNVMHFDILKLDKSLIDYIGDEKGEKLLYHTIQIAKSLGMSITAEGVEHEEQVTFLQRMECDDIQGYYFSKPLPMEDYQQKLIV